MQKRIIAGFCAIVLILSMSVGAFANTDNRPVIENRTTREIPAKLLETVETVNQYITVSEDRRIAFDEDAAISAGEDERIIELGRSLVEFSISMLEDPKETLNQVMEGLPVYGRWCGPGYGGGTPIDALDELCMSHDKCYEKEGYFSCSCDKKLMEGIVNIYNDLEPAAQQTADLIFDYFFLQQLWCTE